jgi:hypothetical protein
MFKMIGAALILIFLLSIHAQGKVQGDPIVIGTQPEIQNPELKEPKTLAEAKEQIAKLKETISVNHIIWTVHCKAAEERLVKHFSTGMQNLNHPQVPKKSNGSSGAGRAPAGGPSGASVGTGGASAEGSGK